MTRLGIGSAHVRTLNGRELMKSPEWRQGRPRDPRSGEIDRQWVRWKVSCLFVLGRSPLFKFSERRSKKAFKYHRAQPTCESFPSSGPLEREKERECTHCWPSLIPFGKPNCMIRPKRSCTFFLLHTCMQATEQIIWEEATPKNMAAKDARPLIIWEEGRDTLQWIRIRDSNAHCGIIHKYLR